MRFNTNTPAPTASIRVAAADLQVGDRANLGLGRSNVEITEVRHPAPTAQVVHIAFKAAHSAFWFDITLAADEVVEVHTDADPAFLGKLAELAY